MSENHQRTVFLQLPKTRKIDIKFEDIFYTVPIGREKGKKHVLKGVSGQFKCGELTAIMGPSGAGKSSLLNILTGFNTQGVKGKITSGNLDSKRLSAVEKIGTDQYKKESCYILQDDQLPPMFTVHEVMIMAVDLKIGRSISEKGKEFLIDDVLSTLKLLEHKETRCEMLSGGQKKRLSIALELVDNPPVMFLDEPTTGLDSSSSSQCVQMLKSLARGGRTIICTIHQPSATLYELFDHVYVLSEGQCVFQGSSLNTVQYLSGAGFICPKYHNPADYLMEVANGDYGNFTEVLAEKAKEKNWRNSLVDKTLILDEEKSNEANEKNSEKDNKALVLISPPSEWIKFKILVNRTSTQIYRDWTVTHVKFLLHIFTGILLGVNYLNIGNDGSKTFENLGYLIISIVYLSYTSMMPAVLRFPSELPILRKERFNNWYCLKTYYAAFNLIDAPLQIGFCSIYATISYLMSAQPLELTRYLMFLFTCMLVTLTSESYGIMLGTLVNPINGTFFGAITVAAMLVVAGFLVFFSHMPKIMLWVSHLSLMRHGLEAMVQSVYGYGRESLECPEDVLYCHYKTPQTLLEEIGMDKSNYWYNIGMLILYLIILRVLAFCTLKNRLKKG